MKCPCLGSCFVHLTVVGTEKTFVIEGALSFQGGVHNRKVPLYVCVEGSLTLIKSGPRLWDL